MDFVWMRPAMKPIPCSQISELSSSAEQVLIALERQFQPFARSCPASVYQPLPNRQAVPGFQIGHLNSRIENSSQRNFSGRFSRNERASPNDDFFLNFAGRQSEHALSHAIPSDLTPNVNNNPLHLSRECSELESPHCELSLNNKVPLSKSRLSSEDIAQSEDSCDMVRRKERSEQREVPENFYSFTNEKKSLTPKAAQDADSNCSSPMSDITICDHLNVSLERDLDPSLWALNENGNQEENCGCSMRIADETVHEHGSNEILSNVVPDDTLYDSTGIRMRDSVCNDETDLFSNKEASFSLQNKNRVSFNISWEDNHSAKDCLQVKHLQKHSGEQSPLGSDDLHNISFHSSSERDKDTSKPKSAESYLDDSFSMEDIFNFSTEGNKSAESGALNKILVQSPVSKQTSSSEVLVTSNFQVQRKFLGTPFKRATASFCILRADHPKGENFGCDDDLTQVNTQTKQDSLQCKSNSNPMAISKNNDEEAISTLSIDLSKDLPSRKFSSDKDNVSDSKSITYFPLLKPRSQTKRKSDFSHEAPKTESSVLCKKKSKFKIPYMNKRDAEVGSNTTQIVNLTEKLANEIGEKIITNPPHETSLTLLYKEGFCQLDRPETCESYSPKSILLRIVWPSSVQFISIPLQEAPWSFSLMEKLFCDQSRKICFESQEIVQLLIDKFHFNALKVSSEWLILDPLIGCWLLNPDEPPLSFKDVLAFLKVTPENNNRLEMLLKKLSQCTAVLYEKLNQNGLWKLFLHIESRITPILACMELYGIQINVQKLKEMAEILKLRLESLQKRAYAAAGEKFQLTSPQQLSTVLYEHLKLDVKHNISVKETGKRHYKSTSESVLIKFKDVHPLPGIVLEFRSIHKLKSTYVDAVLGHVLNNNIYTTWSQTSASTGRITSNEPNLQAILKQPLMPELPLRSAFVAREGFSFLAADFQHIELRVFAHLSKDISLIKALTLETDVFKTLARKWLQLEDGKEVCDEDREKTKRIVYSLMYGAGPSKLSEFLHIDLNDASTIFNKFAASFPKIQQFSKSVLEKCRKQGYLATEAGRRRWFPDITSSDAQMRMQSERQAINFLVQGTAADLCKCAMVSTQRHLAATAAHGSTLSVRLLLQIHDELLWEVPNSNLTQVSEVVQEAMEGATSTLQSLSSFSVPLPVVMKAGKTWGEMSVIKSTSLGPLSQQC